MPNIASRDSNWLGDPASNLTVVVKTSKLCNLRCSYCYEYADLGDRRHLSAHALALLFERIRELAAVWNAKAKFCWHGGEPLLLGPDYYRRAIELQEHIFGSRLSHLIQTNLFKVGERELETIRLFDHISISFDAFGDARETAGGKQSRASVVSNMDLLRREQIGFGVITVLTAQNISHLSETFRFFVAAGLSFRVLPYYREADLKQTQRFGLSHADIRSAYLWLIDNWMQRSQAIAVNPVEEYLEIALRVVTGAPKRWFYDKRRRDHVLMINTNGDVYAPGTAYDPQYRYGNVLTDDVDDIITSDGRRRAVDRSESLMAAACGQCEYYGHCPGYAVGEQTDIELRGGTACSVAKPSIGRTVAWLNTIPGLLNRPSEDEGIARVF